VGIDIGGTFHRVLRHAWVLAIAAALGFVVIRPTAPAASSSLQHALSVVQINAVVERPAIAPMLVSRPAQTVVVHPGDTIDSIAGDLGADAAAIRWANGLAASVEPLPRSTLLVPPTSGGLVRVRAGETPTAFASRLRIDPRVVLDYNALTSDAPLPAGIYLQVPLGSAPVGSLIANRFVVAMPGVPEVAANLGEDTFPYGQCTWYVASRRNIQWSGNAIAWWWAAAGIRAEGHIPVQGAIAVFDIGWLGHVAYVEHVNLDGSFVISEMNYYGGGGWGRVDRRSISASDGALLGFIY
jgi:hypothetical protein